MRIHDPKLRKVAHTLSVGVFIAFKAAYFYILLNSTLIKPQLKSLLETVESL